MTTKTEIPPTLRRLSRQIAGEVEYLDKERFVDETRDGDGALLSVVAVFRGAEAERFVRAARSEPGLRERVEALAAEIEGADFPWPRETLVEAIRALAAPAREDATPPDDQGVWPVVRCKRAGAEEFYLQPTRDLLGGGLTEEQAGAVCAAVRRAYYAAMPASALPRAAPAPASAPGDEPTVPGECSSRECDNWPMYHFRTKRCPSHVPPASATDGPHPLLGAMVPIECCCDGFGSPHSRGRRGCKAYCAECDSYLCLTCGGVVSVSVPAHPHHSLHGVCSCAAPASAPGPTKEES
jgi:hypothetical protein